jgi:hypothetical protein
MRLSQWSRLGLGLVLAVGVALRLVWGADIEYKADEAWTFQRVTGQETRDDSPWLGMPSSVGITNPGMSLWIFQVLGWTTGAETPPELARSVAFWNIIALLALVIFAFRLIPAEEREPWLWAAALLAVNPMAVVFARKIWPPSTLSLLTLLFLAGWARKARPLGAFTWGLMGALVGQIHMSGFFFTAGIVCWSAWRDRTAVAWRWWLLGSGIGALPLIPWFLPAFQSRTPQPSNPRFWVHAFEGKFYLRWILEPLGFGLDHPLGKDFLDFVRHPILGGQPTYLVLVLHVVIGLSGMVIFIGALRRSWSKVSTGEGSTLTKRMVSAALWGFGLLFTLSCLKLHRHYNTILFALPFVWMARHALIGAAPAARRGRFVLATLCVAQAALTWLFLGYVHEKGTINGEYGRSYSAQVRDASSYARIDDH